MKRQGTFAGFCSGCFVRELSAGEVSELRVVAVCVAPVDVVADQLCLCGVVGVVGAVETEIAEPFELRFDPVEPGGVVRRVGELGVVVGRPGTHLVAFVDGEVVEHERESRLERVAAADLLAEGEELDPRLAGADLTDEQIRGDVERTQQMADTVRAGVGGADPARLRTRRPRLASRLRLQVERTELIEADDDIGVAGPGSESPSAIAYSSKIRFFLASKSGSLERFQLLTA